MEDSHDYFSFRRNKVTILHNSNIECTILSMTWKWITPGDYEGMSVLIDIEVSERDNVVVMVVSLFGYGFLIAFG